MDHTYQLARLAELIAVARARPTPVRLVLRNSEQFGITHLYFTAGRLMRVEGYRGTPLQNLMDLTMWRDGVIRLDELSARPGNDAADPRLEAALADTLNRLVEAGVIALPLAAPQQADPPAYRPPHSISQHATPVRVVGGLPPLEGEGVPPLPPARPPTLTQQRLARPPIDLPLEERPRVGREASQPGAAQRETEPDGPALTAPQWQLLALATHQVVAEANQVLPGQHAEGLMRQALGRESPGVPFLRSIELDDSGWLRATTPDALTHYIVYDAVEAIAALLGDFERRCGEQVGAEQAQRILIMAMAPFRASLAQLGLIVSPTE